MVSSERIPNESYAQRARKASTSSTTRVTLQKPPPNATLSPTTSSSSLKPPQVNVWAERISQQKVSTAPQSAQMPRQRATSLPQPPSDDSDAIQPRSPPPDLSTQLAILNRQDHHDPFVVRVPPHLSRQSSFGTNPVPTTNSTVWPTLSSTDSPQTASNDSPLGSAPPSRHNSTASFPHHAPAHSPSGGSFHLSRVQSSFSQHSRSASQSRVQSRSGSSASSPRLQFLPRPLPQDDPIPPDPRSDHHLRRSSNKRSSPQLLDPSSPIDSAPPPADPPYYPRPPVPPRLNMPPSFPHIVPHYALPLQFPPAHVPGHVSPSYMPRSGQGTPPYSHFPPYPAYMYTHPSLFWHDVSVLAHFHSINNIPPNLFNATKHPFLHKMVFGSVPPAITKKKKKSTSKASAQAQDTSQPRTSKDVVFGTIDLPESQDKPNAPATNEQRPTGAAVEHATEQFSTFSIGVTADEPGPSRFASRKSSVRSLSKLVTSQLPTNDVANDAHNVPPQGVNGIKKPVKWEFGSTLNEDFDDSLPPSPPSQTSQSPPAQQSESSAEVVDDQPEPVDIKPSVTRSTYSMVKSDTESSASDVWVVKDYGYGFGDHSGSGNAPNVVRWEMREREKQRVRENYLEREMIREQHRDRVWVPQRQHGWRLENGPDDGREGWEQVQNDALRLGRPRRGSLPGYGHDRGAFTVRRGRGFGARYHGGRARGSFFHHQRFGSYPFAPPQPPAPPAPAPAPAPAPVPASPPPFELPRIVNGYGQPPYVPPEVEPYEAIAPQSAISPQSAVSFTPTVSVDAMRNCLLAQLEYYLSPQNMAQDLYLRQRMDDEGWIPISLLASFKRVQQLHTDGEVVKEVLSQSKSVEVSGDWARMGGGQWEVFVLPNAPKSTANGVDRGEGHSHGPGPDDDDDDAHGMLGEVEGEYGETEGEYGETEGEYGETEGDYDGEDCEADEEEDDVEFVIGEEAEGRWMPVPERKS